MTELLNGEIIKVPLTPVPWMAPLGMRKDGKGRYSPRNYDNFRKIVTQYLSLITRRREILDEPIRVDVEIVIERPTGKRAKKDFPTGQQHGDYDNFRKAICDVGNKILWTDDKLILGPAGMGWGKRFTNPGEQPHFRIYVERVKGLMLY